MFPKDDQSQALLSEENDGPSLKLLTSRHQYQPNFKRLFFVLLGLNLVALILTWTGIPLRTTNIPFKVQDQETIFPEGMSV